MPFEKLVALNVTDDSMYQTYRDAMMPILASYGGAFGYDFKIAEVLAAEVSHSINRVFTLNFPDENKMDAFFSDPEYKKVRTEYFDVAVAATTLIAHYEKSL